MSRLLLVLRPEPASTATIARAAALGLETIAVPLFEIVPLRWDAPDPAEFGALMITSANAVRHAGTQLARYSGLRTYAVGEATADTLAAAGFADVRVGQGDAIALIDLLVGERVSRVLHLCGEQRREPDPRGIAIERIAVYAARTIPHPPGLADALARHPVAMLHSPRAAAHFAALVDDREAIALAAISRNAADAAGPGWGAVAVAEVPSDQALLAIAARMCKQGSDKTRDGSE